MPSFSSFFDYWHNIAKKSICCIFYYYVAFIQHYAATEVYLQWVPLLDQLCTPKCFLFKFLWSLLEFCQKRHMLHISLLCSINAAVCCNQGMYSIDTPSRSIQHKKIPPSQNFYTYCKDLSYKSPCTVYFTITQHNCCSMQQPRHDFDRYPF